MLQQTQVRTVTERYKLFLKRFPTLKSLAKAPIDDVMALWSGLGYYTRARNLHRCAQIIMVEYGGEFPRTREVLESLPGIGRSTAGAIAVFAYEERSPILDANVKRVLSRIHGIEGDLQDQKTIKELWVTAEAQLPSVTAKMPTYTQALMDFGATWCTPKHAKCLEVNAQCPMTRHCTAYQTKRVNEIPVKKKKSASLSFQTSIFLIQYGEFILLERRAPKAIWGGLYSLIESPWEPQSKDITLMTVCNAQKLLSKTLLGDKALDIDYKQIISVQTSSVIQHVFSHRRLQMQPHLVSLNHKWHLNHPSLIWVKRTDLGKIGLPQPIRIFLESSSR
jgi:A/G-specific adenine glycosylase